MTDSERFSAALESPAFSHCSSRRWCGQTTVYVYHINRESPSGVLMAAGLEESEAAPILAAHRKRAYDGPLRGDLAFVPNGAA